MNMIVQEQQNASGFLASEIQKFIEDIKPLEDKPSLVEYFEHTLGRLGIAHFTLAEISGFVTSPPLVAGNFPEEWVQRYITEKYVYNDPVSVHALRRRSPISWDELTEQGLVQGRGQRIFKECESFGMKNGITVPIFDSQGYAALVSFASSDELDDDPNLLPAINLIAIYFHGKMRSIAQNQKKNTVPQLTPRERECLRWAAAGKTDWEMGEILSISESTAHTHLENAKRKLGVPTRMQAVMEAMRHSLILVEA